MTAACPGGAASQPKSITPPVVSLGGVAISDLLLSAKASFWFDLAVALGIISFDTPTFCAGEPPALPVVDHERYLSYFFTPFGAATLRKDMGDLVGHYFWYAACECVGGVQPPPPDVLPPPSGVAKNPHALSSTSGSACGGWGAWDLQTTFDAAGNIDSDRPHSVALPANQHWMQFQYNGGTVSGNAAYPVTYTLTFRSVANGPILDQKTFTQEQLVPGAAPVIESFALVPGCQELHVNIHTDVGSPGPFGFDQAYRTYCSEAPVQTDKPCCPPDPLATQMLAQIMAYLQELLARGTGTSGYVKGAVHAARTGSASLPIAQLAGMLIDIDVGTPTVPLLPGNPPYQWDLGWMSFLTGDGMIEERRITRQHQVWLAPAFPLATTFGYFLNPGITATFTELVAS